MQKQLLLIQNYMRGNRLYCEASLLKIPSIFPDNGGIKEFFPKDYELKFNHNDKNSLRNILENLESYDLVGLGEQNSLFTKKY